MRDEVVLDASVAAKCFFPEEGSAQAGALVMSGAWIIAPDLIFAEMASVAAKRVRRDGVTDAVARRSVNALGDLLNETWPMAALSERAFDLAWRHGLSAYDGAYVALAEARGARLVTADERLVRKAVEAGLGDHVALLADGVR